ncbi:MAG: carbon starvation protein A, partial [Acidobacteriota bacterium]
NIQIAVALLLGWLVYRRGVPVFWPSLVGFIILLAAVIFGARFAAWFPALSQMTVSTWVWILMIYSFIASVLPVWLLLQPRDYLNSHQLLTGLTLMILGVLVLHPTIKAPAINAHPAGAPPLLPFLFITIACGAISGFHGLVSSGTTSKQIACATDARPIGYGGMLGEGVLGMIAVLATTAGFATTSEWFTHYASWGAASGLSPKLGAFVTGGGSFIAALGVPAATAQTFVAVMVIAFAATSLDTGARIQRLIITELADAYRIKPLTNRYVAGTVAVGSAFVLALTQAGGKGGLVLWPLFGTTNQLVAGVTLLVVSVWLRRAARPVVYTLVPMLIVVVATCIAMIGEIHGHVADGSWLLATSGGIILVLDIWVLAEGAVALWSIRTQDRVRPA